MSIYNPSINFNITNMASNPFYNSMPTFDFFNQQTPLTNFYNFQSFNFNQNWNFDNSFTSFNNMAFSASPSNFMFNQFMPFQQSMYYQFQPVFQTYSPIINTNTGGSSSSSNCTYKYANLSRGEALKAASNDAGLEKIIRGNGWHISSADFCNDIPYAKKGTGALLTKISNEIGEELIVTSALGTKTSPHSKGNSSCSHYNEKNPKLDFGGGLNHSEATSLANKLKNTGYFSRVAVEANGDGNYHLDVQIKDSAYNSLNVTA